MFTVENLAVRLGDKNILQNVHFTIDTPGQLVGILGANGSGKTTLLRAVAGLLPHTGCCLMDGVPLESLSTRCLAQTVSYIPQQSGISVSMSAREVVLMGCNPRLGVLQSPTAAMCAAAEEALRTVGLADKAEQDYLTLSGGENASSVFWHVPLWRMRLCCYWMNRTAPWTLPTAAIWRRCWQNLCMQAAKQR